MPLIGTGSSVFWTSHVWPWSALCSTKPPGLPATQTCVPNEAQQRKSHDASTCGVSPRFTKPHDFPPSVLVSTAPPSPAANAGGNAFSLTVQPHVTA